MKTTEKAQEFFNDFKKIVDPIIDLASEILSIENILKEESNDDLITEKQYYEKKFYKQAKEKFIKYREKLYSSLKGIKEEFPENQGICDFYIDLLMKLEESVTKTSPTILGEFLQENQTILHVLKKGEINLFDNVEDKNGKSIKINAMGSQLLSLIMKEYYGIELDPLVIKLDSFNMAEGFNDLIQINKNLIELKIDKEVLIDLFADDGQGGLGHSERVIVSAKGIVFINSMNGWDKEFINHLKDNFEKLDFKGEVYSSLTLPLLTEKQHEALKNYNKNNQNLPELHRKLADAALFNMQRDSFSCSLNSNIIAKRILKSHSDCLLKEIEERTVNEKFLSNFLDKEPIKKDIGQKERNLYYSEPPTYFAIADQNNKVEKKLIRFYLPIDIIYASQNKFYAETSEKLFQAQSKALGKTEEAKESELTYEKKYAEKMATTPIEYLKNKQKQSQYWLDKINQDNPKTWNEYKAMKFNNLLEQGEELINKEKQNEIKTAKAIAEKIKSEKNKNNQSNKTTRL